MSSGEPGALSDLNAVAGSTSPGCPGHISVSSVGATVPAALAVPPSGALSVPWCDSCSDCRSPLSPTPSKVMLGPSSVTGSAPSPLTLYTDASLVALTSDLDKLSSC